ncbi:uncharacterized protein MELLADRAFT_73428 [Melampsora larici-populina 98AG31]|uniref:Uncharacterized protein n=1 Tax=Melampsora larici-populina (strain 98AG31 / pathotype 3-4-7) TaxID=747676 RepID=F4S810_MELLP|nr:uncharacterized protein MELLADRAFT_73428 [Melampsora larici-populina 98AG31]EGF99204.1 hypothetical protein MELLADRAFT_73428 [Melampsora larici-populina 98AG31]
MEFIHSFIHSFPDSRRKIYKKLNLILIFLEFRMYMYDNLYDYLMFFLVLNE